MYDEKRALERLRFLFHKHFVDSADGQELLELMTTIHANTPIFPQSQAFLEGHGGAAAWAAYREGQVSLVRSVRQCEIEYQNQLKGEGSST